MSISANSKIKFVALAINRSDSSIIWQHTAREEVPHEGSHSTGNHGSLQMQPIRYAVMIWIPANCSGNAAA